MVALTIGMPTYNDFDGVYFTIQSLRLYQDLEDTELLVVDNYGCEHTRTFVEGWVKARYILATDAVGTAAAKNRVFAEAQGDAVLCCDSHVLFAPGSIARLKDYYRAHPDSIDLLQGPLVYDDLQTISTHLDPVWRGQMWGIWGTDERARDPEAEPFEIWGQGMGVFSCRKAAWPGFHPDFRGFGGEEGYIQEKVRQHGGRCLCLPWLRWGHRFGRPAGVPYTVSVEDKFRNYLIGYVELGLDPAPVLDHFAEHLPAETMAAVSEQVLRNQKIKKPKKGKKEKKRKKRGKGGKEDEASALITPAIPSLHAITDAYLASDNDKHLPLISCICSTYNRPPTHQYLVEEAIESFLRQTYPKKELIVFNDCPGQELYCDAPGVRVINVPDRFPSLGEKHNAAIAVARGELIAIWDDDDISLPWRLSLSVDRLGDADYFNPIRFWMMARDELLPDPKANVGHNLSLYRRSAFEKVGGYPPVGSGEDVALDQALRHAVKCVGSELVREGALTYDELYYIYRWGVSAMHLSAAGGTPDEKYENVGARPIEPGRFQLQPNWRQDYVATTRRLIGLMTCSVQFDSEGSTTRELVLPTRVEMEPAISGRSDDVASMAPTLPLPCSTGTPRLVVGTPMNLGNELFRAMSSVYLAAIIGATELEGIHLPVLGITTPVNGSPSNLFPVGGGQILPITAILEAQKDPSFEGVWNSAYGQRFEYLEGQRQFWTTQFNRLSIELPPIGENEVVINIRAGDILPVYDPDYFPLPLDFYNVILEELGMAPVFVGQVDGDHPYLKALRSRYPTARFISGSIAEDFELVRRSHTKILSVSTFSWMAGWLGADTSRVIMPVAGLFNPETSPDHNFLPVGDDRYAFRRFSPMKRDPGEASLFQFLDALSAASAGYPLVDRSSYPIHDVRKNGAHSSSARGRIPQTPEEWSTFAEAILVD